MTVGELIQRLQQYDVSLPVALADWNEGYAEPSISALEEMKLCMIPQYDAYGAPKVYGLLLGEDGK